MQGRVFVLSCGEGDFSTAILDKINTHVHNKESSDTPPLLVLGSGNVKGVVSVSVAEHLLQLYRRYRIGKVESQTVLGMEDQIVALQLCLADRNKVTTGEFDIEMSAVLENNKYLIEQKLSLKCEQNTAIVNDNIRSMYDKFLADCKSVDLMDVYQQVKDEMQNNEELLNDVKKCNIVLLSAPQDLVQSQMLKLLCEGKQYTQVSVEVPLSTAERQDLDVTFQDIADSAVDTLLQNNCPSPKSSQSLTESYLEKVFLSYITLLVNSRSELALARVINVPERGLDHVAFTDIKRAAKQKNMPMCQTAMSYIMRIRLGGKSYAPDPNSPLAKHVKGIGEFTDLMHKLQTVLEEETNSRLAVKKVIAIIRNIINKSNDTKLRKASVEKVVEQLRGRVNACTDSVQQCKAGSPQRSDGNGGSMWGRETVKILLQLLDQSACQMTSSKFVDVLSDGYTSQKTPVRLPAIFSQFRSPDPEPDSPDSKTSQSLAQRLGDKIKRPEKPGIIHYKACMDWAAPRLDIRLPKEEEIFPLQDCENVIERQSECKTTKSTGLARKVLESIADQENKQTTNISDLDMMKPASENNKVAKKSSKRALMSDSNQPAKKQKKAAPKTNKKSKPLAQGQRQLTQFFRI